MRILLVEDDPTLRNVMCQKLMDTGNRVDTAGDLATAAHLWCVQAFDVVLLDLNLPETSQASAAMSSGLTSVSYTHLRAHETG
jgi:DNA-binding response OmpR family regulator